MVLYCDCVFPLQLPDLMPTTLNDIPTVGTVAAVAAVQFVMSSMFSTSTL